MNILGISALYHDSAACLVQDGEIVAAAQEERFSRKKHDAALPIQATKYCLEAGRVEKGGLDLVVFYEKPITKLVRLLTTYAEIAPRGLFQFLSSMPAWLQDKAWVGYRLEAMLRKLGYRSKDIVFSEHHLSHAASAFYPSPFDDAAILTADGAGEWTTTSIGRGRGKDVELLYEQRFPHSLGLLYSAFTYFTGFRVNSGEYKLMGLAPYGESVHEELIKDRLVDVRDDGSFRLDLAYFDFLGGFRMTNERFAGLFGGPAREPESEITKREMDIAASIQAVTEDIVLKMARYASAVSGSKKLCLAGGVALNCVANQKLLAAGEFEDIWVQPAAGDAGGAVGAALYGWHSLLGKDRKAGDRMRGSFLGPSFSRDEIAGFLDQHGYPYEEMTPVDQDTYLAKALASEKVVGFFQGRMELGPRALGARSILADARSKKMQSHLNLATKLRESFRPFAPAVLAEDAGAFFEGGHASPYMLFIDHLRKDRRLPAERSDNLEAWVNTPRSDVPAITHVDYSARVQTVDADRNPRFHSLLRAFKELTGCGMLVNTSFNVRSEPIVCTPQDAYRCFMRTGIDVLVLESFVLEKTRQPDWPEKDTWRAELGLD